MELMQTERFNWDGTRRSYLNIYYATRRKTLAGRKYVVTINGDQVEVTRIA